jgi:hypothetical protein
MVVDVFLPAAWVSCGGESMSRIVTAKFRIFCLFFFWKRLSCAMNPIYKTCCGVPIFVLKI